MTPPRAFAAGFFTANPANETVFFNPDIPQSVENIILKATAKNLDDRYVSCKEMLYDLMHCMDIEYRDMKRIKVDASSNKELMKYDNGHIDFEDEESE